MKEKFIRPHMKHTLNFSMKSKGFLINNFKISYSKDVSIPIKEMLFHIFVLGEQLIFFKSALLFPVKFATLR